MATRIATVAALAAMLPINVYAIDLEEAARSEVESMRILDGLTVPDGADPNTCGSAPLSTTPIGPTTQTVWQYAALYGDQVRVTAWRIPCSPTDSMIVLTLEPLVNGQEAFICPPRITLLQSGGLQTTAFYLRNDPPTSTSFCEGVLQSVTIALLPRSSTPASFDFDQGMTISYVGGDDVVQPLSVPAYDPSQYAQVPPPGPHSVEVHVRGSGAHYRNCTVTTAPVGGGTQYTASCGSETSLKHGAFERFDY